MAKQQVQSCVWKSQRAREKGFAHFYFDCVAQPEFGGLFDNVIVRVHCLLFQLDTRVQVQVLRDAPFRYIVKLVVSFLTTLLRYDGQTIQITVLVAICVQHAIVCRD